MTIVPDVMLSMDEIVKRVRLTPPGNALKDIEEKPSKYTILSHRFTAFQRDNVKRFLFCGTAIKENKLCRIVGFSNNCKEFKKLEEIGSFSNLSLRNMMTTTDEVRLLLNTEIKMDNRKKTKLADIIPTLTRTPLKTIVSNSGIFVSSSLRCSKFFNRSDKPVFTCCGFCHSATPCSICPPETPETIDCSFIATFTDDSSFEKGFYINLKSLSVMLSHTELSTANILATEPLETIHKLIDINCRYILFVNNYRDKLYLELLTRDDIN